MTAIETDSVVASSPTLTGPSVEDAAPPLHPLIPFVLGIVLGFFLGLPLGLTIADIHHRQAFVTPATVANSSPGIFARAIPRMDVIVSFDDPSAIERRRPGSEAYATFRYDGSTPCHLHLPAGAEITARTRAWPHAYFTDPYYGGLIAHELMHCIAGSWHPEPH